MGQPWFCTREAAKAALDIKFTARADDRVDDAIDDATTTVKALLHRDISPWYGTRYFDWPNYQYAAPWRLWLDSNDLISVTSVVSGGVTLNPASYVLRRSDDRDEPPYTHLEILLSSSSAFGGGSTHQRSVAITGLWGYSDVEAPAGALVEALDATETDVDVTDSSMVGVGDLIRADSERMVVTGKSMLDTGQNLITGWTTAQASDVTAAVADGTQLHVGEVVLVDSERVLIVDVAANTVTGKRAWDGTVLAAHTTPDIYALRRLTVERGAQGTTAATHSTAAPLFRHVVPGPARKLCIAEAVTTLEQEQAGYARTAGSGDNERESAGRGLEAKRKAAVIALGRKARIRAV